MKPCKTNKCTDCGKPCKGKRCKPCYMKIFSKEITSKGAKHGPVVYYKRGKVIINVPVEERDRVVESR